MATVNKTLRMLFLNEEGRTSAVSLADPEEELDAQVVEDCMNHIIDSNMLRTTGGDLVEKVRAEIVERSVDTVFDPA